MSLFAAMAIAVTARITQANGQIFVMSHRAAVGLSHQGAFT